MSHSINRREFNKTAATVGSLSLLPFQLVGCAHSPITRSHAPKQYDIFSHLDPPKKLYRFHLKNMGALSESRDSRRKSLLNAAACVFQGLVNRREPRIYLQYGRRDVDWLTYYKEQDYLFGCEDVSDFKFLLEEFAAELDGYIVFDPDWLDTVNIALTWGSVENWMAVPPELGPLVQSFGLKRRQDLRGRWQDRAHAYEWAFETLFPKCSKHIVGSQCIHYSGYPDTLIDFLVCNRAFTFDLSAAFRQKREYRLFSRICESLEFPSGVWGWHCRRDHEHWAVARAAHENTYTICGHGMPNLSVHGGFKLNAEPFPPQKPNPQANTVAEKDKVYVAFMTTDGDALWVMGSLQLGKWGKKRRTSVPISWGFLPLLADIAPGVYRHYIDTMRPYDYMVAGPSGAGYTYSHMYDKPEEFLKYSKYYMQRCGLETVYLTNWNDDTNWQEVDLPWFNPLLFKTLNNCIGYIRGMGESAFEPSYNFKDKPYVFCGEGLHSPDKDDVATMKKFIEANPNRPLFIYCLVNISVSLNRIEKVVDGLKDYNVEYVRLDEFMHLIRNAYGRGLITEDLYPNREGNERILMEEAPRQWAETKGVIQKLAPVLEVKDDREALRRLNADQTQLALGQQITDEDKADILAFALCKSVFSLVKNVLNFNGVYVNLKLESVDQFVNRYGNWEGIQSLQYFTELWTHWDQTEIDWAATVQAGREFLKVFQRADNLFSTRTG